MGAIFGAVLSAVAQSAMGGQRDFAPVSHTEAERLLESLPAERTS